MDGAVRFRGMAQGLEARPDDLLEIALAGVDDVDHPLGVAEERMPLDALSDGLPDSLLLPEAVAEVEPEKAELPELVGDVLAHVGHRAVGADDDFVRILQAGEL